MSGPLRWDIEGRDWPHRGASSFVSSGALKWHVQQMGEGPVVLLLHGTGGANHSWRDVMPLLAENFTVIAPDLPGHGFTSGRSPAGMSLKGMAGAVAALLAELAAEPALIVGHSAGAAIALRMAIDGKTQAPIIGFNPAIMPFPGLAARLFPALAKVLFVNPFVPRIFARMARVPGETGRFLKRSTGSTIEPLGLRCYQTLFGNSRHCEGALEMMANWDLAALERALPLIANPVLLVHSHGDIAVPLSSVERASRLLPNCRLEVLPKLGHLAHEEAPGQAAGKIAVFAHERIREAAA